MRTTRAGQFKEALALLSSDPQLRNDPSNLALMAELQLRTGNLRDARYGAQRLLTSQQITPPSQVRCHLVLGTIHRDSGQLEDARSHYERAVALAEFDGDLEQLCLSQILMLSLQVAGSSVELAGMLPALRRNVQASGDAFLTISFHIFLAEAETRKGYFVAARQQLAAARSLLQDTPNVFLEGNAAVAAMCLSVLASEYSDALQHGSLALRCAEQSGNCRTALAARLNLGQALLSQGRLAEAEPHLREALSTCPPGGNNEIGVLDALAQVFLARGDLALCEEFLGRIDNVLASHHLPVAYNRYWGIRTKLALLGRLQRWDEADQLIATLGTSIPGPSDSSLQTYLILANAEILVARGKIDEADRVLSETSSRADAMTLENQAQLERLLALQAAKARPLNAPVHFERAFRISKATNSWISCLTVLDEYCSFLRSGSLTNASATAVGASSTILNRIAALYRFSDHPWLLGVEAFWLVIEADCAAEVVLRSKGTGSPRLQSYRAQPVASAGPHEPAAIRLWLDRENTLQLEIKPKLHQMPSLTCEMVAKLVQLAVAFGVTKREQREREGLQQYPYEQNDTTGAMLAASIRRVAKQFTRIASTTIPILITGPSDPQQKGYLFEYP